MKINYFKKRLYLQLIVGVLFISCSFYSFLYSDGISVWIGFTYLLAGIFHLADFFNHKSRYLIIENASIEKTKLFGAKTRMDFDEIQTIEKVDGSYVLKSENNKLKIEFDRIDNASLIKLMEVFKNLNLPPEQNYFSKLNT